MSLEHRLAAAFLTERPAQAAAVLEQLPRQARVDVFGTLPQAAARAVREMSVLSAADALAQLEFTAAASLLDELPIDLTAMLLRRLPPERAEPVIRLMPSERQETLLRSLRHPDGTAGALMDPAVMALPEDITTADARIRVRREAPDALHYVYVVDRGQRLVGVVGLPELLRTQGRTSIRGVMRQEVERIHVWTLTAAVRLHPGWGAFHAMPVVDEEDRLVGVLRYRTLKRLEREAHGPERPAAVAIMAMGELFQLGLAGFVEGVAAVSARRDGIARSTSADRSTPGASR
jgi:magnesium transporter